MKNIQHNEKIIKRLEDYVSKRGDNFAQLTLAIGVSVGYFSRMRKFKGSLGAEVLARILLHYRDLSADWLLTGQGSMLRGKVTTRDVQTYEERERTLKEINASIAAIDETFSALKQQAAKLNKLR